MSLKASAVTLAIRDGRFLVGHRISDGHWGLPGGKIEIGEDPIAAAKREMKEEFGLDASNLQIIYAGQWAYDADNNDPWIVIFYRVDISQDASPVIKEPDKCDELRWVTRQEALQLDLFSLLRRLLESPIKIQGLD